MMGTFTGGQAASTTPPIFAVGTTANTGIGRLSKPTENAKLLLIVLPVGVRDAAIVEKAR